MFSWCFINSLSYEESVLSRISKFNLVRRVGFSSYSLYLLHQPFFAYYRIVEEKKEFFNVALNFFEPNLFQKFFIFFINSQYPKLLLTVFLVILSFLIYEFVEKPFIKNEKFKNIKLATLTLSVLLFSLFFSNKDSFFVYPSSELNEYSMEKIVDKGVCWGETPSSECLKGDGNRTIYLIGDSQLSKIAKQLSNKM